MASLRFSSVCTLYDWTTKWQVEHHRCCTNGLVTSHMAPAHPHATSVAVYPALF